MNLCGSGRDYTSIKINRLTSGHHHADFPKIYPYGKLHIRITQTENDMNRTVHKRILKMEIAAQKQIALHVKLIIIVVCVALTVVLQFDSIAAVPLPQSDTLVYIVQPLDTLNSIALRFSISAEDLQNANGIIDPNSIQIGQQLIIPGIEGIRGIVTSEVLPFGTSLTSLTRRYAVEPASLIRLNKLTSPSEVMAGIKFLIAVDEGQTQQRPVAVLMADEPLLEVAIRNNRSVHAMVEENRVRSSSFLLPTEAVYTTIAGDEAEPDQLVTNSLSIDPLPLIQGETVEVSLMTDQKAELSGSFDQAPLTFFSDDGIEHYSFAGIHALAETGPVPLTITATLDDGRTWTTEQLVLIAAGDYGNEWVFVPEDYLDEATIISEDAYLEPIVATITPERLWEGRFQAPVDDPCINSLFGQRRDYNDGSLFFYHTGLDFAVCAPNLNVYAPASGKVVLSEKLTIKGNAIIIDHGWGVFTAYAHLSEMMVSVGDRVQPGDLLGLIGNTGRSAGSHLHFEVIISGNPVNPQTWLSETFP